MDNFYKALTKEQQALAHASKWDFDSPNSIDMDLAYSVLKSIKEGYAYYAACNSVGF
jgi:uridine kinase